MSPCRLLVTGASGSGTTTLGRALATQWSVPHADADDYFWLPTSPPYSLKREVRQRVRLMEEVFLGRDSWVLSGSLLGWGEPVVEHLDAVVFLSVDRDVRLDRLRAREKERYGARIEPGGVREAAHSEFMAWAGSYEDPEFDGRNRVRHEQWLTRLRCPVLRLDGALTTDELLAEIGRWGAPSGSPSRPTDPAAG